MVDLIDPNSGRYSVLFVDDHTTSHVSCWGGTLVMSASDDGPALLVVDGIDGLLPGAGSE